MKRIIKMSFISLMIMMLVVGCSENVDPKTYVNDVVKQSEKKQSYSFEGSSKIKMRYTGAVVDKGIGSNLLNDFLEDFTVKYEGVVSQEPEQMEVTLSMKSGGEHPYEVEMPLVVTDQDVYFQLPTMDSFQMPKSLEDTYIKVDANQDKGKDTQKKEEQFTSLINDVTMIIIDHLEEDKYYEEIPATAVPAAEGVEIDQAIKVSLDNASITTFLQDSFEQIGLEILDLIEQKYMDTLGISNPQMKVAKEAIEKTQEQLDKSLANMDDFIQIDKLDMIYAADVNKFITYQGSDADITFKGKDGDLRIVASTNTSYTNLNQEPQFKIGIPEDTLNWKEVEDFFNDIEVPSLSKEDKKDSSI